MFIKLFKSIFPDGYPTPPSEADIRAEAKRRITAAHNIPLDLIEWLESIECPYMREACALILNEECSRLEQRFSKKMGCVRGNCWSPYWEKREEAIADIVGEAREQQLLLESEAKQKMASDEAAPAAAALPEPQADKQSSPEPKVRTILRQVAMNPTTIINNYYGAVGTVVNHADHL